MGGRSKYRKFTEAYRELAVRRLQECGDASELCRELGIPRQLLSYWQKRSERDRVKETDPAQGVERQLRQEVTHLQEALARKTLEVDFFKGALQKVAALRQGSTGSGGTASTSKSGK
ncbi:MAG TPA: transposase [Edaphobacter sp.]|nr:transposase [Edaphobacter sp.]